MDLDTPLDSCNWYDTGNFLQTCIKNSLLETKSIEISRSNVMVVLDFP